MRKWRRLPGARSSAAGHVDLKMTPSAKEPTHGYSKVVTLDAACTVVVSAASAGAVKLRTVGALEGKVAR